MNILEFLNNQENAIRVHHINGYTNYASQLLKTVMDIAQDEIVLRPESKAEIKAFLDSLVKQPYFQELIKKP